MNLNVMQSWFKGQTSIKKKIVLLQVAYEMSIVLRSMSTAVQKSQLLAAAMLSSELNHRLSSELVLRLTDQYGFSDDDLISMIDGVLSDDRLSGYAANVWTQIVKKVDSQPD